MKTSVNIDPVLRGRITDFWVRYCWLIDNDKLEQWTECFDDDGRYEILPRNNADRGMALGLMTCRNKAMIQDRVLALRVANEYNIHHDRHMLMPPLISEISGDRIELEANFMVAQTDQGGNTRLFAAGAYRATLRLNGESLWIKQLTVILDSFCVPTLIATPL